MNSVLFFLSSGLFLGWSLGANDASNVFGTAVESRMIRFRTAAIICSIFVLIGAVFAGAGAAGTLGKLAAIPILSGAFMVALSAGLSVYAMTRLGLPVSTSQAIVGGLIGWNLFRGIPSDINVLKTIASTWLLCPLLAAGIASLLFIIVRFLLKLPRIHILYIDSITRWALLFAGAFGSFSLGANNIGNVVGVFITSISFSGIDFGLFSLSGTQQLFLIGGLAIAVGILTYSRKVMRTIGSGLFDLSPPAAFIAVFSHSLVLFLFSSVVLRDWLISHHLPSIPLVPVSSSQAIVGAVLGIGLVKNGGRNIRFLLMGKIVLGWVVTPLLAALIAFVSLYLFSHTFFPSLLENG